MAFAVYEHLNSMYGYSMNVAAVHAALAADMGFSCEEYQLILTPCFVAGMAPCFRDTRSRPEGSFFPVRCDNIVYHGVGKRDWGSKSLAIDSESVGELPDNPPPRHGKVVRNRWSRLCKRARISDIFVKDVLDRQ